MSSNDLRLFLRELWHKGVELWLEGDQLRFRGDKKVVSGDTLSRLRANKTALIDIIKQNPQAYTGFPLSHGQRSIYLMQSMAPESFAYNQVCLLKLTDQLDTLVLENSIDFLLQRHAPLRMSIENLGNHMAQQVSYSLPSILSTEEIDIQNDAQWQEWISHEADRPFNLSDEPLIRAKLLVSPGNTAPYHLLLVVHHIIADFWALELIIKELASIYLAGLTDNTPEDLPEIGKLFKDYVIHEQDWLASEQGKIARDYWIEKLTPLPPTLELPTDFSRPQQQSFHGKEYTFNLGQKLTSLIKKQAKTTQVTPFSWVLSCYQILLHRYTGENNIAIGSPVACRTQSDFQRLAGHFTNPIILLTNFKSFSLFKALLYENKEQTLQALKYQEYPLQCLIEDLHPQRDANTNPLFQVAISWNQLDGDHQHTGELIEDIVLMGQRGAIYDLVLSCFDRGDNIELSWRFNSDIFKSSTIERLAEHLKILLEKSCHDSDCKIADLDLRTEFEIIQANEINKTTTDYPKDKNIAEIFRQQALQFPDYIAFKHEDNAYTYQELELYSNQLGNYFLAQGVKAGQHITLCMNRSYKLLASIIATLKLGCIFAPINPDYPEERIAYIATTTATPLMVSLSEYTEKLTTIKNNPSINIIYLDKLTQDIDKTNSALAINNQGNINYNDIACVVFTSGSTGKPKGVQVPHRAISRLTINTNYVAIQPGDKFLHLSNVSFDAINIEIWNALLNGGCVVCIDNDTLLTPEKFASFIHTEKPQAAFITTALFNLLIAYQTDIFQSFNYLLFGGEAHDINQIIKCINSGKPKHLFHVYGPTENGSLSTAYEIITVANKNTDIPIGKPLNNNQAYIHDQYGQATAFGVIGEIIVGGDGISTGYLNQPELTAKQFTADHYTGHGLLYATGDLGYMREDGEIVYAGRIDDQVKIRGYRIELGEIEQNISHHPLVNQSYVMVKDNQSMPYLAAWYTASEPVEPATIKQFLRSQLPEFMIPSAFMQVAKLPINPNGKIDKNQLPEIHIARTSEYVAPRNISEKIITDIWQTILQQKKIGIYDNFFELGGHSLLAVKVASALQEQLQTDINMRMIFEHPYIADLAEILAFSKTTLLPPILPVANKNNIPASLTQQRLWFLQQLNPRSKAYNMPVALRFSMPIKTSLIEKCIRTLIIRHEALRTSFIDKSGVAYLNIESAENWSLPIIDLSQLTKHAAEKEAKNQINMLANNTFNLANGLLLKSVMITINNNEHILAFCLHHIIIDGWSVEVLFAELGILWENFQHHDENPLPELPIQYSDYSQWQRQWMQGSLLESQLDYWKQQLTGAPTLLNLPTDKLRPPVLGNEGAEHHFTIPETIIKKLRILSQKNNATLFISMLAGFSILLSRYSQQYDICIGFPISGRNNQALEPLIGLFVNNLVVRCNLSGNPGIDEYIQLIRKTTIDAYANQDVPFDLIIDALQLERSLSYTPLLQVSFSLEAQNIGEKIIQTLGAHVRQEPLNWHIAKYDINLTCYENQGDMQATIEYNTDLYAADSISRMANHYIRLLEDIVSDHSHHINELQILTPQERQQFVLSWQEQKDSKKRPILNAINRFEIQATTYANKPALTFDTQHISYIELNERANQLAHFLQQKDIGAGNFVGLYLERSIEMVISIIAILKTGAAYIPLDPNSPTERINFIIEDAEIQHVLSTANLTHQIMVKNLIQLDEQLTEITSLSKNNLNIHIPNDANAYVIYTSGTTGKPKGCLVSHRNLARLFTVTENHFSFNEKDVWTLFHSYAFDFSVWEIWGALLYGGRLVIIPYWLTRAPDAFYQLLQDQKVTILNQTPSAFSQLIAIDQIQKKSLQLRQIIFGGEALDFTALQQWVDRHPLEQTNLINMYGITETTVHVTYHKLSKTDLIRGRSIIGKALDDLHIHLLDTNGQHVPLGVLGEIYISGAGVTNGYLNRESLTNERFLQNPFIKELTGNNASLHQRIYRSGDLARRLINGDIEYLGRIDHQVKIRGYRIELGEIEAVLSALNQVHESIVIAREDEPGNKRLVAYLLTDEHVTLDINEIRRSLKDSLPDYMIPTAFVNMSEWPLTANGKIDKLQLPTPSLAAIFNTEYIAPRNDTELAICGIWSDILGVEKIGIHANFFELGGHSLLATQVASRIRSELDCTLELKAIFENPTVAELAVVVLEEEIDALNIDESDLMAMLAEIDQNDN